MNKEWSEQNKQMQALLRKEATFSDGIATLFNLRKSLMSEMERLKNKLNEVDLAVQPFPKANGYHNKTIAYSLWHIFRIEDIVTNTLIADKPQVLFAGDFQHKTNSPIFTTGNELQGTEIADFSAQLNLPALYEYIRTVDSATTQLISSLTFRQSKETIPNERREKLVQLGTVSQDDNASWLIDYWCNKDMRGLIQMPLSRHWIMHVEACLRIERGVLKKK